MMGTLAAVLAGSGITTPQESYWADVEGDIENVGGVLKITRIKVSYTLKAPRGKKEDAESALSTYINKCPAAQSVMRCIEILDYATIEEID